MPRCPARGCVVEPTFLGGAEVAGLASDKQVRTGQGEDVGELDRPEAAVGDDQVGRACGAGQRVGEAVLAVALAAEVGIDDSVGSDFGEHHRPHLWEAEGDAAGGRPVERVAVAH